MPLKDFITCKGFLAGDGHVGQIIWLIMRECEEARRAMKRWEHCDTSREVV